MIIVFISLVYRLFDEINDHRRNAPAFLNENIKNIYYKKFTRHIVINTIAISFPFKSLKSIRSLLNIFRKYFESIRSVSSMEISLLIFKSVE